MIDRDKLHKATDSIINILQSYNITEPDDMRKVLGLTLSSVHSVSLAGAKTDEEFTEANNLVLDTVGRILESASQISKDCGREFKLPS
jgi:histidinol phosphatase-like PHP family hydrolase